MKVTRIIFYDLNELNLVVTCIEKDCLKKINRYTIRSVKRMLDKLKRAIQFYEEVISLPHKGEIARELRNEDDVFLLLLYSEMIGIPNPVFYYSLELYPYIIEEFHEWHLRMGMEKSPLSGIRCC